MTKTPSVCGAGKRPGLLASVSAGRLPHATSFARGWVANGKVVPPIVALKPNFCSILSCGSWNYCERGMHDLVALCQVY